MAKNPPAMREIWVQSLGLKDSLEEGMTTHSSILAWRIPWTEEPGQLQFIGRQRVSWLKGLSTQAHRQLPMLQQFQVNSEGTQPHLYTNSPPNSPPIQAAT